MTDFPAFSPSTDDPPHLLFPPEAGTGGDVTPRGHPVPGSPGSVAAGRPLAAQRGSGPARDALSSHPVLGRVRALGDEGIWPIQFGSAAALRTTSSPLAERQRPQLGDQEAGRGDGGGRATGRWGRALCWVSFFPKLNHSAD